MQNRDKTPSESEESSSDEVIFNNNDSRVVVKNGVVCGNITFGSNGGVHVSDAWEKHGSKLIHREDIYMPYLPSSSHSKESKNLPRKRKHESGSGSSSMSDDDLLQGATLVEKTTDKYGRLFKKSSYHTSGPVAVQGGNVYGDIYYNGRRIGK